MWASSLRPRPFLIPREHVPSPSANLSLFAGDLTAAERRNLDTVRLPFKTACWSPAEPVVTRWSSPAGPTIEAARDAANALVQKVVVAMLAIDATSASDLSTVSLPGLKAGACWIRGDFLG